MINENIKKYRKAKGLSQEELAVRLHVVRQTVSKWEKGLSVPDADVLIRMAEVLDIPVSKILSAGDCCQPDADSEGECLNPKALAEKLARLNEKLARRTEADRISARMNEKRNLILFCSFGALAAALFADSEMVSAVLAGLWMLVAAGVLYRNLGLLSGDGTDRSGMRALKLTTVFSIVLLVLGIAVSVLTGLDFIIFTEDGEKIFAMALIFCVMVFSGLISPKLPFTRHTGLRLPWTVRDEDTWKVCHRVLGYTALPLSLIYIACGLTIDNFEAVTMVTMAAWIGIPGGISYVYYQRKMSGKV